jgi:hypothetical protein
LNDGIEVRKHAKAAPSQLKKDLEGEVTAASSLKEYRGGMASLLGKSMTAGFLSNKKVPIPGTANFLY